MSASKYSSHSHLQHIGTSLFGVHCYWLYSTPNAIICYTKTNTIYNISLCSTATMRNHRYVCTPCTEFDMVPTTRHWIIITHLILYYYLILLEMLLTYVIVAGALCHSKCNILNSSESTKNHCNELPTIVHYQRLFISCVRIYATCIWQTFLFANCISENWKG